jgi:hypothetical protein
MPFAPNRTTTNCFAILTGEKRAAETSTKVALTQERTARLKKVFSRWYFVVNGRYSKWLEGRLHVYEEIMAAAGLFK